MAVTDAGAHRQRCVAAGSTGRCFSERTRLVLAALWRARCNVERNVLATDALSTAGEMVPVELMLTATSLQQVRDTRPQLRLRSADRPRPIGAPARVAVRHTRRSCRTRRLSCSSCRAPTCAIARRSSSSVRSPSHFLTAPTRYCVCIRAPRTPSAVPLRSASRTPLSRSMLCAIASACFPFRGGGMARALEHRLTCAERQRSDHVERNRAVRSAASSALYVRRICARARASLHTRSSTNSSA